MLRVTEGDLPPLVAKDMVGFVRNEKINGRKFLRLTEGDLDKYGLNQRWQSALLSASRKLRQGSLRGRIWNSEGMFDDDDDQDTEREDESASSTSSLSSSGSIKDRSKSHGRVKGMVASLERNGSSSSSSRSVSPVKNPFSASMSAVKSSKSYHHDPDSDRGRVRPRPQSDIFPSRSSYAIIDNPPLSAEDSVDQKKEPRLLPLPPPPAVAAANQVDYVPFNTSPSPIHVQTNPGPAAFGPYGSPQLPSQELSFAPFPSGVLPFSPQSTGTTIISQIQTPDPHPSSSLSTFITEPQAQSFDALYVDALAAESGRSGGTVRPLPLPPHPGQFYQTLASSVPQGGVVMSTSSPANFGSPVTGMYPLLPHGLGESSMDPTAPVPVSVPIPVMAAPVPHVQVQHVSESQGLQSGGGGTSSQAPLPPGVGFDSFVLTQQPHAHIPSPQPQFDLLHPHSYPESQTQTIPIFAPQPRHGAGRESPTKILEEKLEELLEPRPSNAATVVHSRNASTGVGVEDGGGERVKELEGEEEIGIEALLEKDPPALPIPVPVYAPAPTATGAGEGDLENLTAGGGGGVEAWGENHRHIVVPLPSDSSFDDSFSSNAATVVHNRNASTGVGVEDGGGERVKELEGEEEIGIEALLEKDPPALPIPVPVYAPAPTATGAGEGDLENLTAGGGALLEKELPALPMPVPIYAPTPTATGAGEGDPENLTAGGGSGHAGHAKEASNGSIRSIDSINISIAHSRTGSNSIREPKSAVITVVEKKPSSSFKKSNHAFANDVSTFGDGDGNGIGEVEESMEVLLAKEVSASSMRRLGKTKTKKRTPLSGVEAWEMVNVDTIMFKKSNHALTNDVSTLGDGDGNGNGESPLTPIPAINTATSSVPIPGAAGPHGPRPKSSTSLKPKSPLTPIPAIHTATSSVPVPGAAGPHGPRPKSSTSLKPKVKKSFDDPLHLHSQHNANEREEETKKKLEELEQKEKAFEDELEETKKVVEEMKVRLESVEKWIDERERRDESKRRVQERGLWNVLSASRVPGMLGLTRFWFGPPPPTSTTTTTSSSSQTKIQHQSPNTTMTLIRRIAKLGLSLSTYAVLFGIGLCVALLKTLGRRLPGAPGGVGVGARLGRFGGWIGNGGVRK
ncbi:hypothetical protein AN958_12363 [Leucoagaricus sp. SymC.cos]|nr:hypothetical protein AN958_12363 [Leucoagaricus sp. SymC.cos]